MGKQARFTAEPVTIEAINDFAIAHSFKYVLVQPSPEHDDWPVSEMTALEVDALFTNPSFGIYRIIPSTTKTPQTKDEMVSFMAQMDSFIELSLFMKHGTGYDSRIWFQTPNHKLEKEANALLRQVRKAIKAQEAAKAAEKMVST